MFKSSWKEGPTECIQLSPPHDRPIFCMAVRDNTLLTGSADHGLREYNMQTGKHKRQLYSKKYGHKEWVSCCAYTPGGKVISGAMDSVVCVWDQQGVRCDHFSGHGGSISKVMGSDSLGMSSSYDASIILWDLKRKQASSKLLGPHKEAIMDFDWHNSLLVSGDKAGVMAIWDLNAEKAIKAIKTHKGAVSQIKLASSKDQNVILTTGLNDGTLVAHDMRSHVAIFVQQIHTGSVNCLSAYKDCIITASADHYYRIIDFNGFKSRSHVDTQDMLFAVERCKDLLILGTGGGNVLVYDLQSGECLYGYGVMKKGCCRLLGLNTNKTRLACAGEDDNATLLVYE